MHSRSDRHFNSRDTFDTDRHSHVHVNRFGIIERSELPAVKRKLHVQLYRSLIRDSNTHRGIHARFDSLVEH